MNIASLNIRGVGGDFKKECVRRICNENKINFLGLQETMMDDVSRVLINSLWVSNHCEYAIKNRLGNPEASLLYGILNLLFSMNSLIEGDGFLAIFGSWNTLDCHCVMILVYAPQELEKRSFFGKRFPMLLISITLLQLLWETLMKSVHLRKDWVLFFSQEGANQFNQFIHQAGLLILTWVVGVILV